MNDRSKGELLDILLAKLRAVVGPGTCGEYVCWCPYHMAGHGGAPDEPNLVVSLDGFACRACRAKGSLQQLAEKLDIDGVAHRSRKRSEDPQRRAASDGRPSRAAEIQALGHGGTGAKGARRRKPKSHYRAVFDDLVDVVQANGGPVFLVRGPDGLELALEVEIDGKRIVPPQRNTMPWLLARGDQAMAHYDGDTDAQLYAALAAYHQAASTLPDPAMYGLLALWDMHTYLLERLHYSPIVVLCGLPERGKTRTGKAMVHVAYRGMHVESLREAYIIRTAAEFGGTLFFDVRDVWGKSVRERAEDLLLQRFERGVFVPRVMHPHRGAHQHTAFFRVFGPTIIATNQAPDNILETRGVTIAMPEAAEDFASPVRAEDALPLKERLVAFRARHMGEDLPDVPKPVRGRLGDILQPLAQIQRLVAPDFSDEFLRLAQAFERERAIVKGQSLEAAVIVALLALEDEVSNGVIPLRRVGALVNSDRPERERVTARRLGEVLRALGINTRRTKIGTVLSYQHSYVELLARRQGIESLEAEGAVVEG
jgi:hypothetical protein